LPPSLTPGKFLSAIQACRKDTIFGSAVTDNFIPEISDIDFLVKFQPDSDLGPWMAHYFGFRDELGELLVIIWLEGIVELKVLKSKTAQNAIIRNHP
jgi:predicted nucleotidyltransferase